ncbi:MAG: hypothetical protein QM667_10850 [Asticcacaulis sp.]
MLGTWVSQLSLVVVLAALAISLWLGDARVRKGAAAYFLTFVLQAATFAIGLTSPLVNLCLDGGLMVAFIVLSWKSPSPWPVWAALAQLITVMIAAIGWSDPRIKGWAYYTALMALGYMSLLCVLIGAFMARHHKRLK